MNAQSLAALRRPSLLAANEAREFNIEPRVAMLSFSNFGSTKHPLTEKVRQATEIIKREAPELMVDGEMQADTAVVPEIIERDYPFPADGLRSESTDSSPVRNSA